MTKERYVVPQAGLTVRDPVTMTPLPAQGMVVPWNSFWRRRQHDGSVVVTKGPVDTPTTPSVEPDNDGSSKSKRR